MNGINHSSRRGHTLVELLLVVALVGTFAALSLGKLSFRTNGGPVEAAQMQVRTLLLAARAHAIARHVPTRLLIKAGEGDDEQGRLLLVAVPVAGEERSWRRVRGEILLPIQVGIVPTAGVHVGENPSWPADRHSRLEGPVLLFLDGVESAYYFIQFTPSGTTIGAPQIVIAPAEAGPIFTSPFAARGLLLRGSGRVTLIDEWLD